eukprot:CAMPEP_0197489188 /NCGR_PEP_ID=MMETSP1311-20131121/4026_1 /TAXON_ID=464262 /ORGANISM="Genus nov. species nov., Strain RCC856" /LENGTH=187 /DNA_ID=CAMNT_0043033447 /DNA_START=118 /DNA_END=681 /DNA_ORIENTATION=-
MTVLSRSLAQRGAIKGLSTLSRGGPARGARATRRRPVAARAAQGEDNFDFFSEFGILSLRLGTSVMMFHNGLDKLVDPEGFSTFVVAKYLDFLPEPLLWTYGAIAAELACPVLLALGVLARPSAAALLATMTFATIFHLNDTGLEGFPLAVVEKHQYGFETSALYAGIFFYFLLAGPGKLSLGGGKK